MSLEYALSENPKPLVIARGFHSDSIKVGLDCGDESRTKQSFADECNINNIVRRYAETGYLPPNNKGEPQFGDAPALEFKEALDYVRAARAEFDALDPKLASQFEGFDHYLNVLSIEQEEPDVFQQLISQKLDSSNDVSESPKPSKNDVDKADSDKGQD